MRKTSWKTLGAFLAAAMMAGSLSACGSSGSTQTTAAPAADNKAQEGAEAPAGEVKELSWYVGEPESHVWSQTSYEIAEEIEEKTNGSLKIKVYPGATLGTQAEALDMLRTGSLAFEISGPSILASFYDPVQVYSLPYAFDNPEQAYAYFASEGSQKMYNDTILNASGVRTLDVWYYGKRNLTINGLEPKTPC